MTKKKPQIKNTPFQSQEENHADAVFVLQNTTIVQLEIFHRTGRRDVCACVVLFIAVCGCNTDSNTDSNTDIKTYRTKLCKSQCEKACPVECENGCGDLFGNDAISYGACGDSCVDTCVDTCTR